jgi:hypothetical protein
MNHEEPYAEQFIEDARRAERCVWCGRDKRRNSRGLCRSCDGVRRKIERLEKLASERRGDPVLEWELQVAHAEKEDCIAWGEMLRGVLGHVDSVDLEHWFCMLAKRIAGDDRMYANMATALGWSFSPEQHRMLAYLFWRVFSEEASRRRWLDARYKPVTRKTPARQDHG